MEEQKTKTKIGSFKDSSPSVWVPACRFPLSGSLWFSNKSLHNCTLLPRWAPRRRVWAGCTNQTSRAWLLIVTANNSNKNLQEKKLQHSSCDDSCGCLSIVLDVNSAAGTETDQGPVCGWYHTTSRKEKGSVCGRGLWFCLQVLSNTNQWAFSAFRPWRNPTSRQASRVYLSLKAC